MSGIRETVSNNSPVDHTELADAVRRYQAGELEPSSDMILTAMASRISSAACRVQPVAGLIDSEDLRQQLAAEVLMAARGLRLNAEEWIPRMLMERALRNVRRWRRRQARLECKELDGDLAAGDPVGYREEECLRLLIDAGLSPLDSDVIVGHHVGGQPFAAMALRLGISEATLRSRACRAAERLRGPRGGRSLSVSGRLTCATGGMKGD